MNLLLIVAVIAIWGTIAYRIISALDESDDEPLPVAVQLDKKPADDYATVNDTARLRNAYRDPFGMVAPPAPKDTVKKHVMLVNMVAKPVVPVDLTFVKYAGYIINPGTKQSLVMLLINGKTAMLGEGESSDGIKVIKNMRDSVKVRYRQQIRYIVKSSS